MGIASCLKMPINWLSGRAGLHRGPRRLKMVLFPIRFLAPVTCLMAGKNFWAKRKTKFFSFRNLDAPSASRSIGTFRASSTSADPERELTALFPCLATGTKRLQTIAAVVEMLKLPLPSPPVPHVSRSLLTRVRKRDGPFEERARRGRYLLGRLALLCEEDERLLDVLLFHPAVEHFIEEEPRLFEREILS